jgi:hypothetical protein
MTKVGVSCALKRIPFAFGRCDTNARSNSALIDLTNHSFTLPPPGRNTDAGMAKGEVSEEPQDDAERLPQAYCQACRAMPVLPPYGHGSGAGMQI